MDQHEELKRSKTLQETMPLMPGFDMMNMQEQAGFSFAPVEDQVEQNLDEQIQANLEEVEVIEEEKLVPPTAEEVKEAHKNLGVKMPSDPVKRSNRLKESKKNFDRSKEFINAQQEFREKQSRSNIANDLVDFKKIAQDKNLLDSLFSKKKGEKADEFLVKNYGEIQQKLSCLDNLTEEDVKGYEAQFKTLQEIRHFYDLQGQLMSNKYYTLIPGEEMQNLSYKELKKELLSEYEKKDRNMELIRYYETLIKLKNCEVKDKKSAKEHMEKGLAVYAAMREKQREKPMGNLCLNLIPAMHLHLGQIAEEEERKQEAAEHYVQGLQARRYDSQLLMALLNILPADDTAAVIELLNGIYSRDEDAPFLLNILKNTPQRKACLYYDRWAGLLSRREKYLLAGRVKEAAANLIEDISRYARLGIISGSELGETEKNMLGAVLPADWQRNLQKTDAEGKKLHTILQRLTDSI